MGRVTALFLAGERETPVRPVDALEARVDEGLVGDRHANKPPWRLRQVLLVDAAQLEALSLLPGQLKENVLVDGLALDALPAGQRLKLGEVVLELTMPCVPCQKLERIRPGLLKESWGRRGQLAKVVVPGTIGLGADVTLLDVNPDAPPRPAPRLPG